MSSVLKLVNGGGGGMGLNHLPLLFRKIVYRIKHHLKMINTLQERKTYQPINLALAGTPAEQWINLQPGRYQLATDRNQLTTRN